MNVSSSDLSKRNFWRRGLLGGLAMALGLIATAPSCSFVVDTNEVQCSDTTPCGAGRKCSEGVCIVDPNAGESCAKTSECVASKGEFHFCRKDNGAATGECVALKSALCDTVEGDYQADDVFFIGSIHPKTPVDGPDAIIGISMEESIKLALSELKKTANGLPPAAGQTSRRQVVMIGCSDEGYEDKSVEAATHLVDNVGVQAIIGGAFSGIAIQTATEVTIPNQVLFVSASGTSPAITDLADKPSGSTVGLVWRTVPSDNFQAQALVEYVKTLETDVRTELGLMAAEPIKVAILHKGDAYGTGLKNALQKDLVFNNKPALSNGANYIVVDYGNPDEGMGGLNYGEAIDKAVMNGAHVVLLFGTGEAITEVYTKIEVGWTAPTHRPRYVFSDANFSGAVADIINVETDVMKRADLRRRTTGVVPGPGDTDSLYKAFLLSYGSRPGDATIFGSASAYDAAYLLFYSAAFIKDGPITGIKLAEGMANMSNAAPMDAEVDVGTTDLPGALNKIADGTYTSIDYNGAFGPLNFDSATGEPAANVQIFCLADDGTGKATHQLSGSFYNADTGKIEGAAAAACK
ncbi:MAG: ABC transporter substrate-binding protein [Polyangiaceae bacterium]|nr:ABC transporter substrate-binding protein [Polyangiaceae bacterium]